MSSELYALGIDIGGTHLRMGLIRRDGTLSLVEKRPSADLSGGSPIALLESVISDYMCRNGVKNKVVGVCIGFPATVDKARETVLSAPNLPGFDGVPVGRLLAEQLSLPVIIERDVNLLLLDDLDQAKLNGADTVACYVGTGIGNAIFIDGRLLCGHNGVAGELGHIPFGDSTTPCGCGNLGCAEALAGGRYLAELQKKTFPDTPIGELFTKHRDHPLLCGFTERLGRVIATEVNLIDPELVLLGGGVIEMRDFPKAALEQSILAHTRAPYPRDGLKICYSKAEHGVRGAGILIWKKVSI